MTTHILSESGNGVLTIVFDRPDKKNALTAEMYAAIADHLQQAQADPAVRAILLRGSDSTFTAGNDLEDFLRHPPHAADSPVIRFLHALAEAEKPLVAAVCGAAVGVGTTMLLHCDLVYAGEQARFAMPFTQLGLCPEAASSLLLPQIAGYQRAAEKLLLGDSFSAREALEMGFVCQVLPDDQVIDHARKQAARLAALPAAAVRTTKRFLKAGQDGAVARRMQEEINQFGKMLGSPEAREAFAAFFEKRKPDFSRFP